MQWREPENLALNLPGRHPPQVPLPEAIWARIASFMTTQEWVAATRTCRVLWETPLDHMALSLYRSPDADGELLLSSHD